VSVLPCRVCKSESPRYVFGNRCSDCVTLTYNEALNKRYADVHKRVLDRLYDQLKVEDNPCIELGSD
jgi:hypothetical protein